jgi:hypothetical protein
VSAIANGEASVFKWRYKGKCAKDSVQRKTFKTSDGAELSYISAGEGKLIVMLHGWSQSAEQFGSAI